MAGNPAPRHLACAGGDGAGDLALVGDRRAAGGEGEQDGGPAPPEAEEVDIHGTAPRVVATERATRYAIDCSPTRGSASERAATTRLPLRRASLSRSRATQASTAGRDPFREVSGRIGAALVDLDERLDRGTALLELRSRRPGDREPREVEVDTGAIQPRVGRLWRRPAQPAGGEVGRSHRHSLRKRDVHRSQTLLFGPKATRLRRSADQQREDEQQADRSGTTHPDCCRRTDSAADAPQEGSRTLSA